MYCQLPVTGTQPVLGKQINLLGTISIVLFSFDTAGFQSGEGVDGRVHRRPV